jgi:type II secretory ATPase GspE/PulE/Tfp pilus assembly ATPase PilB-like protein
MSVQGGNGAVFDPYREQQGRLTRFIAGQTVLLRWASIATDSGPSVCLRLLGNQALSDLPTLEKLGYFSDQIQALRRSRLSDGGAVIFAGLVGSGKSTTLAALLRELPDDRKLITLEDPVEYNIENALQCSVAGALDEDTHTTFDRKLKAIKRSAVQDLLIGEIRDQSGGRAFADLLLAGVNVYTTVHAASALQILNRLASNFIDVPRSVLAMPGMLKLLVYQALLPRLCTVCRLTAEDWLAQSTHQCSLGFAQDRDSAFKWLIKWCDQEKVAIQTIRFRNPSGCVQCLKQQGVYGAGYAGRTVVAEIIEPMRIKGFVQAIESESMMQLIQLIYGDAELMQINQRVRYRSLQKATLGELDPREIERRFGDGSYD